MITCSLKPRCWCKVTMASWICQLLKEERKQRKKVYSLIDVWIYFYWPKMFTPVCIYMCSHTIELNRTFWKIGACTAHAVICGLWPPVMAVQCYIRIKYCWANENVVRILIVFAVVRLQSHLCSCDHSVSFVRVHVWGRVYLGASFPAQYFGTSSICLAFWCLPHCFL